MKVGDVSLPRGQAPLAADLGLSLVDATTRFQIDSIRRQIEGELAWNRLLRAKIESQVSVGDEEVKAVIDRMNAAKGSDEFHVGEIVRIVINNLSHPLAQSSPELPPPYCRPLQPSEAEWDTGSCASATSCSSWTRGPMWRC